MASQDREYDVILYGATGYTGKITAEYITTHLPTDLKWAVAGRSASKLEDLVKELQILNPNRPKPGIESADLNFESLSALAKKARLIITTVGPYAKLGEPVIEACVKNGTHYVDWYSFISTLEVEHRLADVLSTGEIPWVKEMIKKYDSEAKANGAIIIPVCGFESVPADLASWALVKLIREKLSKSTKEVILSLEGASGGLSGGTLATGFSTPELYSMRQISEAAKPWALSPVEGVRYGRSTSLLGLRTVPGLGVLTVSPMAALNRSTVHRTWGLLDGGKAYGPNFRFNEYTKVRNAFIGIILRVVIGIAMAAFFIPPMRSSAKHFIAYKAIGIPDDDSPSTRRASATMRFQGGGYYITGACLAEAAITILRDDTQAKALGGGFLTPATLGEPLINRLAEAKLSIQAEILDH
ncbi:hypothetical protein GP486_000463 [Trichoglossum hirsutum]|uniref:Saccharopine dehydrogenase NADP binding domain-containing protein n=1 Tax=Trichoglossum hirsutum TaxID=265104 RepID=A0A9P8RU08_9PEZI|nr:hypothetical protein GP486_000463 [Trichoglossum hirsutum]